MGMAGTWHRCLWATDRAAGFEAVTGTFTQVKTASNFLSFGSSDNKQRYLPLGMGPECGDLGNKKNRVPGAW